MHATLFQDANSQSTPQRHAIASPCSSAISLGQHEHVELNGARGAKVGSVSGTLWITQDGDLRDVILEAGESFELDRDGKVLLSPIGAAQVCIGNPTAVRNARVRDAKRSMMSMSSVRAIFA